MKLKPYPEYRDSGLPWLREIPVHWEEKRAKYFFREVDEHSKTGEEELLSVSHLTGVTPRSQKNVTMFQAESYVGHKLCRPGDLVVNTMWAWMAALGVAKQPGIVSSSYAVYRPRKGEAFVPEYLDHLLRTKSYVSEYYCRSTGIRSSRLRLYPEDFLDIPVIRAPLEEQGTMVAYIRAKDHKFADFIRAKQRLIELLNEQKGTIIHRTVTRGLDPNVLMKPTGLDWLPEVPEHWELLKLKFVTELIVGGSTPPSEQPECWDGSIVWVTPEDVSKTETLRDSARRITAQGVASCSTVLVPAGSIVVTSRAPVGNVSAAEVELCTNQGCKALVPRTERLDSRFAHYLLRMLKPELQSLAKGTTFPEISTFALSNVLVPIPPIEEQREVVDAILSESRSIEGAIERTYQEIDLIREYRTRLISDVVSGKLDVREVELPEPGVGEESVDPGPDGLESVVAEGSPDPEEVPDAHIRH